MAYPRLTLADLAPGRSNVSEIILRGGQAQADAALRGGDAMANAIGSITGTLAGGVQKYGEERRQQGIQKAVRLATSPRYPSATKPVPGSEAAVADPGSDHMRSILDTLSPEDRPLAIKGIQEIQGYADKVQEHNLTVQKLKGDLADAETKRKTVAADYGAGLGRQISQWLSKPDGGLSAALFGLGHAKGFGTQGLEEIEPTLQALSQEWDAAAKSGSPEAMQAAAEKNRQTIGPLAQQLQMGASPEWQEKNRPKVSSVAEGGRLVNEETGATVAEGAPKQDARPLPVQLAEALQAGDTAKAATIQKAIKTAAELGRDPLAGQKEKFWVVRDGKPIRVSESEYRPGDKPANTREQGRPVTSGDAGRIADLDTSLDDLNALTGTVSGNKATGTAAKVGSMVPNFVTEFTGWGTEAKQKQATIDRVKQVIGKALEGGVLRKEDEAKYEKILPTIGDTQEVVATKLDGLWKAIQTRRQTTLESLADAGYDTAKYTARAPRERQAPESADGVTVLAPDGKTYRFKSQAQADVFKKRAGIK